MRDLQLLLGVIMFASVAHAEVRRPAVAGSFYPGDRPRLEADVRGYLRGEEAGGAPIAVIVPHAGYIFSGATAGRAFAGLAHATVRRAILLGPSHHAGFSGGALPAAGVTAFATPLGDLPIDLAAVAKLRGSPEFSGPPAAHEPEHCLEVELPFLQETVGAVPIVPVLVGHATDRETAIAMAHRLAALLDPTTIVVVSSDFTHHGATYGYAPFGRDRGVGKALLELGRETAGRAAAIDADGFWQQVEVSGDTVCGARPISVLLELLRHAFNGHGQVLAVTTSGEVSGTWSQVVTYAAVSFTGSWSAWRDERNDPALTSLDADEQKAVLSLARATLETHLTHDGALAHWFAGHPIAGNLAALAGVFVTLHNTGARAVREGRLRGCIGVMEAREPLVDAVVHAATSAAHDPRFPALQPDELSTISLEVSVLSPMTRVAGPEAIEMGVHGVVLGKGGRRAVFLPQVATETGWTRDVFLSQLAVKAGLPPDAWHHGATFEVFTAQVFSEPE
ncbi:MAG: AmmeMemoRadiSam system protein B [Acidobacteriota bacterium]